MRNISREIRQRSNAAERRDLSFRAQLDLRGGSIDEETRSIEAVISTENPVPMFDWERGEMIPEVLVAAGMSLPPARQIPLLDSHARWSIADQLGSAREIATRGGDVVGRIFFSSAAESAWTKVREGHARDVSAGYQVLARTYVAPGETRTIGGKEFRGPVNVVTKWRLREVSLTPIGADEQAKLRGLQPPAPFSPPREFTMDPELKTLLVARGMDAGLSDEAAQRWLTDNRERLFAAPAPAPAPATIPAPSPSAAGALTADEIRRITRESYAEARQTEREEAVRYDAEIRELCGLAGQEDQFDHCRTLADARAVRQHLTERQAAIAAGTVVPASPRITVTGDGHSRLLADIGTALTLRCMGAAGDADQTISEGTMEKVFPKEKRARGADQWRHASPFEMATRCVESEGWETRGATREQIAMAALGFVRQAGLASRTAPALAVTGSFANLTLDAFNKSMMVGYTEHPGTWRGPMRQATSVPDFKQINRIRLGAIPNLPVWNDNLDPEKARFADAREYYAVEARSLEVGYSYKLLVNDDMDALSRTPGQMGTAASRTVNAVAWAQITGNPLLSDGVALFATAAGGRKRDNLQTGAATPTTTTVGAMTKLMRLMRGENTPEGNEGDDVLNLQPRYIVGPAALEVTINQLVNSAYDPNSTAGMQQVYNPNRVLTPIIEPLLDASSATAWYLFASPSQIDTVEVTFLQGHETPVVRDWIDERNLARNYVVLQCSAAKAMNHRGMQKHAGA